MYIREVHPAGARQSKGNKEKKVQIEQPETFEERVAVARTCMDDLKLSIPAVVDGIDDKVSKDYAGFPDRLYIVDKEGKIAYRGDRGPRGFKPFMMEKTLKELLREAEENSSD